LNGSPSDAVSGPGPRPAFSLRGVRQVKAGAVVLDGVDLDIPLQRLTALVGRSGAGKTSLLRLLNRLDDPAGGSILFLGHPIEDTPVRQLRRRVGFVFQSPVMFAGTVRDNLKAALETPNATPPDAEAEMRGALELAELDTGLLDREGDRLSVGEKQRANIARALMSRPEVLLMDEPTSALDPDTADRLMRTIRRIGLERALTVVMVTHRMAEARGWSDLTVVLDAGRVVAHGAPDEVLAGSEEPSPGRSWQRQG
jgi:putative ABC transport system ATP-binding protein